MAAAQPLLGAVRCLLLCVLCAAGGAQYLGSGMMEEGGGRLPVRSATLAADATTISAPAVGGGGSTGGLAGLLGGGGADMTPEQEAELRGMTLAALEEEKKTREEVQRRKAEISAATAGLEAAVASRRSRNHARSETTLDVRQPVRQPSPSDSGTSGLPKGLSHVRTAARSRVLLASLDPTKRWWIRCRSQGPNRWQVSAAVRGSRRRWGECR